MARDGDRISSLATCCAALRCTTALPVGDRTGTHAAGCRLPRCRQRRHRRRTAKARATWARSSESRGRSARSSPGGAQAAQAPVVGRQRRSHLLPHSHVSTSTWLGVPVWEQTAERQSDRHLDAFRARSSRRTYVSLASPSSRVKLKRGYTQALQLYLLGVASVFVSQDHCFRRNCHERTTYVYCDAAACTVVLSLH